MSDLLFGICFCLAGVIMILGNVRPLRKLNVALGCLFIAAGTIWLW